MRKLIFKQLANMDAYRIYDDGVDLGDMIRVKGKWSLSIPCAEIRLTGQYRRDLMEEAEILYGEFVDKFNNSYNQLEKEYYKQWRKDIFEAYRFLRKNNSTIRDAVLDFMKTTSLKELERIHLLRLKL